MRVAPSSGSSEINATPVQSAGSPSRRGPEGMNASTVNVESEPDESRMRAELHKPSTLPLLWIVVALLAFPACSVSASVFYDFTVVAQTGAR